MTISIGDGTTGHLTMVAGMTYTKGAVASSAISFVSTTTGNNITTAGKTLGNVTFNGAGGGWTLQDNLTLDSGGAALTHTAGTLNTNGKTVAADTIDSSGSSTRTLTLGASAINLSGASTPWNFNSTGLTLNSNTSTITLSAQSAVFGGAGQTYNVVVLSLAGASTKITGANTFATLTVTGSAQKTAQLMLTANQTVSGTLTINGNSVTNRVLVTSDTLGTARTLSAGTVTVTNADFMDITGAGAGSWNLSAITGKSGDCGGNTSITFTTGASQTWSGTTGGNWSANAWTSRVPLPQDDVVINKAFSASQTVTLDMPRAGKSISWAGSTGTPDWAKTAITTIFGSVTMIAGMTNSGTTDVTLGGRGSFNFTCAGQTWTNSTTMQMVGGTLTQQDDFTASSRITHVAGTWDANNFNLSTTRFPVSGSLTMGRTMGSGTWTFSGTGTVWDATGVTITANTSTLVISDTSATAKTFTGAGKTYGNVTWSGDNITVAGSNTFNAFALNTAGLTNGLKLTNGTTQTLTSFSTNGSAGSLAKLVSTTAGSAATLSKSSGQVSVDYMSIKDSAATGGASWYAGSHSTNVSGNTGWIFTAPPSSYPSSMGVKSGGKLGYGILTGGRL